MTVEIDSTLRNAMCEALEREQRKGFIAGLAVAKAFVAYYPAGINPNLDAAYVLARKCITNGDVT